jgi:hypothetical protein
MKKNFILLFCLSSILLANENNSSFENFLQYLENKSQNLEKTYELYPYNKLEINIKSPKERISPQIEENQAKVVLTSEKKEQNDGNNKIDYKAKISFPSNLDPYPKEKRYYRYKKPDFIKGIYINNRTPFKKDFKKFIDKAKQYGINAVVIDVQPRFIPKEILEELNKENLYIIARIVVFHLGFKEYPPTQEHLKKIYSLVELAEKSIQNGFHEVQLDYIRFADDYYVNGLTLGKRYRLIAGIIKLFEDRLRPYGVRIGADIFGRVPFYEHDYIGQKMEIFDRYFDHIHPMLYPSHFYGMEERINNPYQTIYDGIIKSKERTKNAEIIPYIQSFRMSVKRTGLTFREYIKKQILACIDAQAKGFIAWNAKNEYDELYNAIKEIYY